MFHSCLLSFDPFLARANVGERILEILAMRGDDRSNREEFVP
jgi:hypothetical protein